MKVISVNKVRDLVANLCIRANTVLRADILTALKKAYLEEKNKKAKNALAAIIENAAIAKKEKLAICQDTGLPCIFVELGQEVKVSGDLMAAINRGVESGYKKGYFRNSIIKNSLERGEPGFGPAIIHIDLVRGSKLKISVLPKGFGCENKSRLKMFNPTASLDEIKEFIVDVVKDAKADACPPYVVGVGIGGTAEYAGLLAKKALLKKTADRRPQTRDRIKKLENDLLEKINELNIGVMGLGGVTCLGVHVETAPTHIAGLPVAVNISCHALRSATGEI
ncbi:MAG: fumarate hydratase [Candidatus Omnitrophota bacterium]